MAIDPKLFETLLLLPSMLDELTSHVKVSADALQEQVERIRALMAALQPSPTPAPVRIEDLSGISSVARGSSSQLRLSDEERARKAALLGQFGPRAKMREEIEADMEAGA